MEGAMSHLSELPVTPTTGDPGNRVRAAYVTELAAVTSPDELRAFYKRWRPLFLMSRKYKIDKKTKGARRFRISQNNMQKLISGDWDPVAVFDCVQKGRAHPGCRHSKDYSCPGMHLLLPQILMLADALGDKYSVSSDLALIQLGGGLERLET
jgi:hypothetical protein